MPGTVRHRLVGDVSNTSDGSHFERADTRYGRNLNVSMTHVTVGGSPYLQGGVDDCKESQ